MAVTGRGRERVTVMVTVDAKFHPVAVHPTLGRAKMDEDANLGLEGRAD
jgi:hypothetical protein